MKILVTGGAGFIGSHLTQALLAQDNEVCVIDELNDFYSPRIKEKNLKLFINDIAFYKESVLNSDRLKEIFKKEKPQKIIHLAARAGVRPSVDNPLLYQEVNIAGTINLLSLAKNYNIEQFIFASTSSIYGINNNLPFNENDHTQNLISPYATSKKSAELYCLTYNNLYKIPTTILRLFTVYGPRQRPEMAIHKFTNLMAKSQDLPVFGDGLSSRDYTYITDIVDGFLKALANPVNFEIFNLGNSKPIKLFDLIKSIEVATGFKAKIKNYPNQQGDVPITFADITKAKKILGWQPQIPLEKGLEMFAGWFSEQ